MECPQQISSTPFEKVRVKLLAQPHLNVPIEWVANHWLQLTVNSPFLPDTSLRGGRITLAAAKTIDTAQECGTLKKMVKKSKSSQRTVNSKSELRRLRAGVDCALEQIVVTNAAALKHILNEDLEKRVGRVEKAVRSRYLQLPLACPGHGVLERDDLHFVRLGKVFLKSAARVKLAEAPTRASQHKVDSLIPLREDDLDLGDHLERHLLLGGAGDLLPLHRD